MSIGEVICGSGEGEGDQAGRMELQLKGDFFIQSFRSLLRTIQLLLCFFALYHERMWPHALLSRIRWPRSPQELCARVPVLRG